MSGKDTKEKDKEEAAAEGPRGVPEACSSIGEGKLPDCCGPEMQGMMARMMGAFQTKPEK